MRDALLGRSIADIDVATPAPPEDVSRALGAARIKVVPTGIAHGTVTAVVPPRHFEITTLRRDVETDGRHARVEFTDDWAEDAARRDFTMNALFLDAEGRVWDSVGGLADLEAGRVRFVGDPATRIREDVLRLLRFYRFHAHYGRGDADGAARAACRQLAPLLPTLSGERVAAETLKLLAAPEPAPTLRLMAKDGVLAVLLAEGSDIDRVEALGPADPLLRLAALLPRDGAASLGVATRLRLSSAQRDRLVALAAPPWPVDLGADRHAQRVALRRLGAALYRDLVRLEGARSGQAERARDLAAAADVIEPPPFPLRGRDVTALGIEAGARVGALLKAVESWWEEGDFAADRAACLAELRRRAGEKPG